MKSFFKCCIVMLFTLCCTFTNLTLSAMASEDSYNRYNVVYVLDASGSMNDTDPKGYRYEAIKAFTGLLADNGNNLGCVVFSDHILAKENLLDADSISAKDKITNKMQSVEASGFTNIGEALSEAVTMLKEKGDGDLPSVIVFLSDGNTAMATDDELEESLESKANAIQEARDNDVKIHSVCLNVDESADIKEMEQISASTGGVCKEISSASELNDVYDMFYELIYGSSSKPFGTKKFSDTGKVTVKFDVPTYGVEEINVVVYGKCKDIVLKNADDKKVKTIITSSNTFMIAKTSEISSGAWKAVIKGNKDDEIKVNLICNNDIQVSVSAVGDIDSLVPGDKVKFEANIISGNDGNATKKVYKTYDANLHLLDVNGKEVDVVKMKVNDDSFTTSYKFDEGTYSYYVDVQNDTVKKTSDIKGPLEVSQANNTAPVPVNKEIKETVNIWPFKGGSLTLNLTHLATDEEDEKLSYTIRNSSFIENVDYKVENQVLKMDNFSLKKGDFVIIATDSGGLSCEIKLVVKTINIGLLTLIGLGIGAIIGLIVVGVLTWLALTKPFRGRVTVYSIVNGTYEGREVRKARGRIKLTIFGLQNTGLNYQKCHIQATGKRHVFFESSVPVYYGGQPTKKVKIESDIPTVLYITEDGEKQIEITFRSDIPIGYGR